MLIGGSWRPSAAQECLLAVALGPQAEAAARWAQWRAQHAQRDLAALDSGTARLLPLLMPRLDALPLAEPARALIAGYYRRCVYHSRLLRARSATVIARFAAEGIQTLVLKGGVLGPVYYEHVGLRPMSDFDVLVPRAQAVQAIRILLSCGWRSVQPLPEALPEAYHSACFQSPDPLDFDLHWHLLPEACFTGADDPAWEAAEPFDLHGQATKQLCATDLLVVVCAHAGHWMPTSPVRWIPDAMAILRHSGARIDWSRVATLARRWHVEAHLRDTLGYLALRWDAPIPMRLLQELAVTSVHAVDRRAYRALDALPGALNYLSRPWLRYRLRTREQSALRAAPGFVRYLQVTLGRESARTLPREIIERFFRWRADRSRGVR